jgi:hypothetical protein
VINSRYSIERKLPGLLTVLGEEAFNVPVDEKALEAFLQFMFGESWHWQWNGMVITS